jgi:hypothetical protein
MLNKDCIVLDFLDKHISNTNKDKAFYLVRKGKAIIVNNNPLTIRLNKIVEGGSING